MDYKFTISDNELSLNIDTITSLEMAFDVSIAKWETLLENAKRGIVLVENGFSTCGLCIFYHDYERFTDYCGDCPINNRGMGCEETPYDDYIDAYEDEDISKAIAACEDEIKLLKDLKGKYVK